MTVQACQAAIDTFSLLGLSLRDNQVAAAAASSNLTGTALRLSGQMTRFTTVPATGVAVLPSLLTGETSYPIIVINQGASALTIYAYNDAIGHPESLNGTASTFGGATGGLSIAATSFAVCVPQDTPKGRGGVATTSPLNWSAAVFS